MEGTVIEIEKSVEKRKLRAMIAHWNVIIRKKDGKCVERNHAEMSGCGWSKR